MAYTAQKLVEIAKKELGYYEKASLSQLDEKEANKGAGNFTKYARDLAAAGYYNGNKQGVSWCDVFVDWCFYQLTDKDAKKAQEMEYQTGTLGAGCKYSAQYYRSKGRFFQTPNIGDQIFFGEPGKENHTGIVIANEETYITTIEGNSDNKVTQRYYSKNNPDIVGYGRPNYEKETISTTPTTTKKKIMGIDVSEHNGTLDWAKLKKAGVEFAMIRTGYGQGHIDSQFENNIIGATAQGIPVGVYHFSYALNVEGAKREAKKVLEIIKNYKITFPIFYDFEYDTVNYAKKQKVILGKKEFNEFAVAFLNIIEKAGYTPGIYYNLDYYNRFVDTSKVGKYCFWYAHYSTNPALKNYDLWQYTETGILSGVSGTFDLNIMKQKMWDTYIKQNPLPKEEPTNIIVGEDEEEMTQERFNEMMTAWIEQQAEKETEANWSAAARTWAENNGFITGDEKNRKMYKKFLTREEFVTVLHRIFKSKGLL